MASLELRSNRFRLVFRFGGKKFQHPLKTTDPREAEGCRARIEENIRLLERGRLELPPDADLAVFLLSDGKTVTRPTIAPAPLTFADLCSRYEAVHSIGSMEASSLATVKTHLQHFRRTLGEQFAIARLRQDDLQKHIIARSKKSGIRKRRLSAVTLRKEIASLRAVWNWGVRAGHLSGSFPNQGLVYPKTDENAPFRTATEIERQIARGVLSEAERKELWNCVFLTLPEIQEILEHVRHQKLQPFVYAMLCFAAHTGTRRSEIIRCRVTDIDFESMTIVIREKKRGRGQRTHRRVPMTAFLADVLRAWLSNHPGGEELFSQPGQVIRSKKKGTSARSITRDEAHDHIQRALKGSKWLGRIRGWHTFRHSFASQCAAKGVDQRLIDSWMGHQTEDMRRRYRHLFPDVERAALQTVFG